mgnify:FL=1
MNILGAKIHEHDTGAALISGKKVFAIAEERLTRVKHSPRMFPSHSIDYCLQVANLKPEEIDLVVLDKNSRGTHSSEEIFHENTAGKFKNVRCITVGHHDAHAASAFFCSPFESAAILVYDGAGDLFVSNSGIRAVETETLYRGEGSTCVPISKTLHERTSSRHLPFTCGMGKLYSTFSREYLGMGNHNEGKMMGLAAYGDDSFLKQFPLERWVAEHADILVCNRRLVFSSTSRLAHHVRRGLISTLTVLYSALRMKVKRVLGLLVASDIRNPEIFEEIRFPRPARNPGTTTVPEPYYNSVAYAAQKIFEHFAIRIGTKLRAITQSENLCVAGGCALNIDANRNFLTHVGFKDLFVQPASADCGIALGCALWGKHVILQQPRDWVMKSASLGRVYTEKEIDAAIEARKGEIESRISNTVTAEVAKLISESKIIGWFQGGSEYGPRALGNRSILFDARDPEGKDILNKRVKHREMWRPFATSILAESLEEWFDLVPNTTTAFMLLAAAIPEEKRKLVPSIVHVDNTCRMQTLTKEGNGIYYDLVSEFEKITGVPLVLNTSFNLAGDPIVETPADALDTFLRTDMDYLVLHDRIVWKK